MERIKDSFDNQGFIDFFSDYWYLFLIAILVVFVLCLTAFIIKKSKSKKGKIVVNTLHNGYNNFGKHKKSKAIRFEVNSNASGIKCFDYAVKEKVLFGRADFCDVVFDDAKMSRYHFYIQRQKKNYIITDLNSANGTYINGFRLKNTQILKNNDRIYAGVTTITVSFQE